MSQQAKTPKKSKKKPPPRSGVESADRVKRAEIVENVPISTLTPDPRNARKHSPKNLAAISTSIERNGFRGCIVVQVQDVMLGTKIVRAGNGRVEALKSLGRDVVPRVEFLYGWTDEEAIEYALADNRTAELAEWNWEELSEQLTEFGGLGENTGFETHEVELLTQIDYTPPEITEEAPYQAPADPETPSESGEQPTSAGDKPAKGMRTITVSDDLADRMCALTGKADPVLALATLVADAEAEL